MQIFHGHQYPPVAYNTNLPVFKMGNGVKILFVMFHLFLLLVFLLTKEIICLTTTVADAFINLSFFGSIVLLCIQFCFVSGIGIMGIMKKLVCN